MYFYLVSQKNLNVKISIKTKKYTIKTTLSREYISKLTSRKRNQYASIIDIKDSHESILRISKLWIKILVNLFVIICLKQKPILKQ